MRPSIPQARRTARIRDDVRRSVFVALAGLLLGACSGGGGSSGQTLQQGAPQSLEQRIGTDWILDTASGGATTNTLGNQSSAGFDTPALNLDAQALDLHAKGDVAFEEKFLRAPSADFPRLDGLGPAFNQSSCRGCHVRDGRANHEPAALSSAPGTWTRLGANNGMLLRLSLKAPGAQAAAGGNCPQVSSSCSCASVPVPGFGGQLFHRSVLGFRADSEFSGTADVDVRFETRTIRYGDGTELTLRRPRFRIVNPWDRPGEMPAADPEAPGAAGAAVPGSRVLQPDVLVGPRTGLPVFGLGLLEAIPEADILALADPDDRDGDGISGRPNWVCDAARMQRRESNVMALGRFGWKANTASVLTQTADAYHNDMGITSLLFPLESLVGSTVLDRYRAVNPKDDGQADIGHEVSTETLMQVAFYSSTLAVPARRSVDDAQVQKGAALFRDTGCASCHHPSFTTGPHPGIEAANASMKIPSVENQRIHPYTDMLLHDMGDELADGRPDFGASGREWKTRPLWGIGLTATVNPLAGFLHDARAATIEEAILWHGGEAEQARERFRAMSAADREALLSFVRSL